MMFNVTNLILAHFFKNYKKAFTAGMIEQVGEKNILHNR